MIAGSYRERKGRSVCEKIDVRCSDRNRVIAEKRILIATGGSATAEMAMKYSSFSLWLSRAWLAFMDESQQYGNYHESWHLLPSNSQHLSYLWGP